MKKRRMKPGCSRDNSCQRQVKDWQKITPSGDIHAYKIESREKMPVGISQ
jgi:hypothetical protein